jgi:pimeloyl-ACP methyl ester carboxylesterase
MRIRDTPIVQQWLETHPRLNVGGNSFEKRLAQAAVKYKDAACLMPRKAVIGEDGPQELRGLATTYLEMKHRDGEHHQKVVILGGSTSSREAQGPMVILLYALGCDVIHLPQAMNMESWLHDKSRLFGRLRRFKPYNRVHGQYAAEAMLAAEVVRQQGDKEVTLVGVSNGAPIMIRLAALLSDKRINLHLLSPGGFTPREQGTVREAVRIIKTFMALRSRVLQDPLEDLLENKAIGMPAHLSRIIDALLMIRVAFTLRASVFQRIFGRGLPEHIRSMHLGIGQADEVFPLQRTRKVLGNAARSQIYEVAGKDHNWQVQGAFTAAVMIMRQMEGQAVPDVL